MKKISLLIIGLLLCVFGAMAQSCFYDTTKEFNLGSYVYQCDVDASDFVNLYNRANTLTYAPQTYKDGRRLGWEYNAKGDTEDDTAQRRLAETIVKSAFTSAEKQRINGENLVVNMIISPETGKVIEVDFTFWKDNVLATVFVSTYRKIELALKSRLQFTVTAKGKELNYVYRGLRLKIQ